jgi:hypothetical protein
VPTVTAVEPAAKLPVAQIDKLITLKGHHLSGAGATVLLTNDRFVIDQTATPTGGNREAMEFKIERARADDFPVGVYRVGTRLQAEGDDRERESNQLALTLAPSIDGAPLNMQRSGTTVSFSLNCLPKIRTGQSARVVIAGREVAAKAFPSTGTSRLDFEIENAPSGEFPVCLRIDGIDSPMIDLQKMPPEFNSKITLP